MISLTQRQAWSILPLDAPFGAVIWGLDAGQTVSASTVMQLKQALKTYDILIFKNQTLTEEEFIAFATLFGSIFVPPPHVPVLASDEKGNTPEIVKIANVEGGLAGHGELTTHIDHVWTPYPSSGSLLYALEVPEAGGETTWYDLHLAYEALDPSTKARIDPLQLISYNPFLRDPEQPPSSYRWDRKIPLISPVYPHPLVRTHPESGKKVLYLSVDPEVEIVGMDPQEGAELIAELKAHIAQHRFAYQHHWSVGDIVYWDNQSTSHHRHPFEAHLRRVMKRISLAGSRPF